MLTRSESLSTPMQGLQNELQEKTRLARLAGLDLRKANENAVIYLNRVDSEQSRRIMRRRMSEVSNASNAQELLRSSKPMHGNFMIQQCFLTSTSTAIRDAATHSNSSLDLSLRVAEIQEELSIRKAAAEEAKPASLGRLGKRARGN